MAAGGRFKRMSIAAVAAVVLAACSTPDPGESYRRSPDAPAAPATGGGLNLFSSSEDATESAISVNAFLWRASLDTLSFMPLTSADPFGGVIITDWYAPPESPNERFKMNVYILGRALRADGLKISVFRQTQDAAGRWADATVGQEVATEVENAVLTRARELRLQSVAEEPKS